VCRVEGSALGEILIPRLGLKAIIVQGESPAILQHAVGHLADTALPVNRATSCWRVIAIRFLAR